MRKTGPKQNARAYLLHKEQLVIAEEMKAAMLSAYLPYVATRGLTPQMKAVLERFEAFAYNATNA